MTVSSTISVFCRDGVFRTVYCHLHGEPTWNGRILHTHYATGQQAEALVEHGDIRCLGPRCDKPAGHTLQNPVDGVTAYYGRDSGFRMDSEARESTVLSGRLLPLKALKRCASIMCSSTATGRGCPARRKAGR